MSTTKVLNVSVCGFSAVGKSSIASRLANKVPIAKYLTTIGVDFFLRNFPKYNSKLVIWDFSGSTRFQNITYHYLRVSNVVIYVYDVTDFHSVIEMKKLYKIHRDVFENYVKTFIVVGNKKDHENSFNSCIKYGEEFAKDINALHIVTSAKENKGITEIVNQLIIDVRLQKVENTLEKIKSDDYVRSCENCTII